MTKPFFHTTSLGPVLRRQSSLNICYKKFYPTPDTPLPMRSRAGDVQAKAFGYTNGTLQWLIV